MKKTILKYVVFTLGFICLILLISNCRIFRDKGVCTYFDASKGEMVCIEDVTEKECEEKGGDFFVNSEPCY